MSGETDVVEVNLKLTVDAEGHLYGDFSEVLAPQGGALNQILVEEPGNPCMTIGRPIGPKMWCPPVPVEITLLMMENELTVKSAVFTEPLPETLKAPAELK